MRQLALLLPALALAGGPAAPASAGDLCVKVIVLDDDVPVADVGRCEPTDVPVRCSALTLLPGDGPHAVVLVCIPEP